MMRDALATWWWLMHPWISAAIIYTLIWGRKKDRQ